MVYHPVLLAQVHIRFLDRKYNLDYEHYKTALVQAPDRRGVVRWENFSFPAVDVAKLDEAPDPQARFISPEAPLTDSKIMGALQKDFEEWAYRSAQVSVKSNEALKVYAGPEVSSADFRTQCSGAAREGRDAEIEKVTIGFDRKLAALQEKMGREERELNQDQAELSQRKMEELGTAAENIFGLFSGRRSSRRLSSSLSKRRMTSQAKADMEESVDAIAAYKKQIAEIEKEKAEVLEEVNNRWGEIANHVKELPVAALKKDVLLDLFGVAWLPYHLVKVGESVEELPGYAESS